MYVYIHTPFSLHVFVPTVFLFAAHYANEFLVFAVRRTGERPIPRTVRLDANNE